jgi:hypothetical protein
MFSFSSTYSPVILILFLAISIALSYFFYRNSPLPKPKKYFLISLKSLAIFLLLFLFIEPVFGSLVKKNSEKLNFVLLDDSRSNSLGSKEDEIKRIISENNFNDYKVFRFSNSVDQYTSADSLTADGFETNLSAALKNLKSSYPDETLNSLTIISDGLFNSGGNPLYEARKFQAPVITAGTGDTVQQKDIVISSALYNSKSFTDISNKIKCFINVYEAGSGALNVTLLKEGGAISSKTINYLPSQQNYETEFDITETTPGKVRYRIQADSKEGEVTLKNNYFDFYIEYIDNKVNVLFISGGPSSDNAFITSILKRISNYTVTFRTLKTSNEFYEGPIDTRAFGELSAIFLLNFPNQSSASDLSSMIASNVKSFNIPLIFFAGKNSDYQKLQAFDELVSFSISRPNSGDILFNLQSVSSDENPFSKIPGINSTTQIFRNVSGIQPKSGAITLITDKSSGEPVLITRDVGSNKSTAFLGFGLWRWRLNSSSDAEKTLEKFLTETIGLTLQKEKKSKFKIYPSKDIFDYREGIKIIAEVYDENYLPTRNASVKGKILTKDMRKTTDLEFKAEENKYTAYVENLPVDEYIVEADAELNGSFYAHDDDKFLVDSTNTEFLITKSNFNALRELSNNTGGIFIDRENQGTISAKISEINNRSSQPEVTQSKKFNLWENIYLLMFMILLFTVEWVVKKRNNIP